MRRQELDGSRLAWLCEVTVRGRVFRFASEALDVLDEDGDALSFDGTLDPLEFVDEGDPWEDTVSERALSCAVTFQAAGDEGFGYLTSVDHDLGDARAEVSLHKVGNDYEDRVVLLEGLVDEPEWAGPSEPVVFSIREAAQLDRGSIPHPVAQVTSESWPTAGGYAPDDAIVGEFYPVPVGRPGQLVGGLTENTGSPALLVKLDTATEDNSANPATVLIGDGLLTCVGSTVLLQNLSTGNSATVSPTATTDTLGREVTTVDVAVGTLAIAKGAKLWVSFRTANSGGLPGPRDGTLEGAGEVIRWLLGRSTRRVDTDSLKANVERLNAYLLAFYANSPKSPSSILLDEVLPLLPASPVLGPRGLSVAHWRLDARHEDKVAHLDLDEERGFLEQLSRTSSSEVANVLGIDFCHDPSAGSHRLSLTFGPKGWADAPGGYEAHPLCSASHTRYKAPDGSPLVGERIETALVEDVGTAASMLQAATLRRCGTHLVGVASGLSQRWQSLTPGDVITVTSSRHNWSSVLCLVTRVIRGPGDTDLGLLSPNNWIRTAPE